MLTADEITDEQIEALRARASVQGRSDDRVIRICDEALGVNTQLAHWQIQNRRKLAADTVNNLPGDVECTVCFLRFNSGDSIATDSPICPVHKPRRKRT